MKERCVQFARNKWNVLIGPLVGVRCFLYFESFYFPLRRAPGVSQQHRAGWPGDPNGGRGEVCALLLAQLPAALDRPLPSLLAF